MGRFSGMEISSSQGLKNPQKLALGKKILPPAGLRPLGGKSFFPWANFWRFFSTLGMKKFPYLKPGPFGNPLFKLHYFFV